MGPTTELESTLENSAGYYLLYKGSANTASLHDHDTHPKNSGHFPVQIIVNALKAYVRSSRMRPLHYKITPLLCGCLCF